MNRAVDAFLRPPVRRLPDDDIGGSPPGSGRLLVTLAKVTVVGVALCTVLFPLYWLVTLSIKPLDEQLTSPPVWIPAEITWEHYRMAWVDRSVYRYFINGMIVSTIATVCALVVGTSAAYALSMKFRGSGMLALLILAVRMIPPIVLVIPLFMIMRSLRVLDTHYGLSFVYLAFTLPYTTWLMRSFFQEVPPELEEAARIDGCSRFGAFVRIILPLVAPGLAASAVFSFLLSWNEFLFALVLTRTLAAQTMPVAAAMTITDQYTLWGAVSATSVIAIVPILILMIFVQKHFVRGLTFGAVKG